MIPGLAGAAEYVQGGLEAAVESAAKEMSGETTTRWPSENQPQHCRV